jgi:hypothetical protein
MTRKPKGEAMTLGRKTLLAALALAVLAAAAAGIARSTATQSIPDANGVIHGCHKKPTGDVKIVYSAADCGPGQAPIQWSQAGPPGPKGDAGPQGPGPAPGGLETFQSDETAATIEIGLAPTGIFVTLGDPGTYWIFAKGVVSRLAGTGVGPNALNWADCELELGFVRLDSTPLMLLEVEHPADEVWFTLAGVARATRAGERLKLLCASQGGDLPIGLLTPRISALKVS